MRRRTSKLGALVLLALAATCSIGEQTAPPNDLGVSLGHWHTIVKDIDATRQFWVTLGGTPITVDGTAAVKFHGVLILMTPGTPSGGSEGSVLNHIGFGVANVAQDAAKWKAAGIKTSEVHKSPLNGAGVVDIYSPDDLMVEITEESGIPPYPKLPPNVAIESNHVHFYVDVAVRKQMRDWYSDMFGGTPGELGENLTLDLPGVKFMRWTAHGAGSVPTKGRALDHIGLEVNNLAAFCKRLQAKGVKFDQIYSKTRHKSFASAEFIDPWGTSVELTEGLNKF